MKLEVFTQIDKRARQYQDSYKADMAACGNDVNNLSYRDIRQSFRDGAEDQYKRDLEKGYKFCKQWYDEVVNLYLPDLKDEPFYSKGLVTIYKKFREAIEMEDDIPTN